MVIAVAVLVGAVVVLSRGDNDTDASNRRDDRAGDSAADAPAAYAGAAARFGGALTFGYRGTVRSSAGSSPLRPGPWIAEEVTVDGTVHLPLAITTEVAVDSSEAAAETVTSGSATWTRRAPAPEGLAGAPWERVGGGVPTGAGSDLPGVVSSRLGIALVADAVQAAGDRTEAPRDDAGRRVVRATVPDRPSLSNARLEGLDDLIGGAELAVTLDDGDIARVELTAAPGRPALDLALDIVRLGDPALVTAGDLAEPIRSSVPPEVLAEVGLGSLDVPGLPTTWALTSASVYPPDGSLGPAPPGCGGPVLALEYHDLRAMANGWLFLSVWRDTCGPDAQDPAGTGATTEAAVDAGRFTGSASQTGQQYQGEVTDGTTAISFTTDLSPEDAATSLASLMPGH